VRGTQSPLVGSGCRSTTWRVSWDTDTKRQYPSPPTRTPRNNNGITAVQGHAAALDIIFQMSLAIKPSLLLRCPRPNQCEMGMHNKHR
jgi:hypothetical protein